MKRIFLISLMLYLFIASQSQNILKGKITDQDLNPLFGASIYIPELSKGTITDENGHYQILNIPNGSIKLQYAFLGFGTQIKTLNLHSESIVLDIVMEQTAVEAEEILVTAGYSTTQHENASKIELLKVNQTSMKNTGNFMESLTKVPGIDMISKGPGVTKPVIRGLSLNDVLVLSNGVRFENYQYSDHHPLGIDEFGIESIEIIKGPASLLYGSDAIGGVINFIKEKPASIGTMSGDYNLQMHSNNRGIVHNLGLKGSSKKLSGGFRFGSKSHEDFLQGGGQWVPNTRFNEHSFKSNLGFSDQLGSFKLYYDYNRQKLGLAEEHAIEDITERGRNNEIFYQQLTTHLLSSQNKFYLNDYKLGLNAAYQNSELIHFGEANEYELQMQLKTLTYETKLHIPSDAGSEYILGFQGMYQENENTNNRETILLPDAKTSSYGFFGLLQKTFFDDLKVQTGIRFDQKILDSEAVGLPTSNTYRPALDKSYNSFSGSIGATYQTVKNLIFRMNFASAYRTPNLAELTSKGPHEERYEIGDANLVPERAYEADASMHYHINNLTFDLAGFYNSVNNFIYISPDEEVIDELDVFSYRQSNSLLYGAEFGIHFHPAHLDWLHIKTIFSSVVGKQKNGDYLPFIPAHKLNFEVRFEKLKILFLKEAYFQANSNIAFDQNKVSADEETTPGYTLFDLSFGGNIKLMKQKASLNITASNILDKKYIDHLSTLRESGFYNPGRNISISLKIPIGIVSK